MRPFEELSNDYRLIEGEVYTPLVVCVKCGWELRIPIKEFFISPVILCWICAKLPSGLLRQ